MSALRAIVVEGVEIPEQLIAEEAQHHAAATGGEARAAAAHALAIKALLLDRARLLDLTADPETDADGREETTEEALIRVLLEQEVEVTTPTDAECRRVFEAGRSRFVAPELYEASHILLEPAAEGEEGWEDARLAAAAVLETLIPAPGRFGELAKRFSDCPSKSVGGSLGQLRPGDLAPEVEPVLAALQPGEIAPSPVRSRFGWHIFRLDRRVPVRELPFEAVEDGIRADLEGRAWIAAASHYVEDLAAAARLKGVALSLRPEGGVATGALSLGDLLADASGVAERMEAWLDAVDPALADAVRAHVADKDETFASLVRSEIAVFVQSADDEAWTKLISAARDADDPALACVTVILKAKLTPPRQMFTLIKRTR
ncbi:MAG: peptidyl-prolyl cis-trans isomerase [Caulobacteraceae bacterium]|nr:peptidyl-prolyl cis-trans isomerase [Caulobacteraceae bacterium]